MTTGGEGQVDRQKEGGRETETEIGEGEMVTERQVEITERERERERERGQQELLLLFITVPHSISKFHPLPLLSLCVIHLPLLTT